MQEYIEDLVKLQAVELERSRLTQAVRALPAEVAQATAALDEETEAAIYVMLAARLPNTTLVSIGHRSTLAAFHPARARVSPGVDGGPASVALLA